MQATNNDALTFVDFKLKFEYQPPSYNGSQQYDWHIIGEHGKLLRYVVSNFVYPIRLYWNCDLWWSKLALPRFFF